ncbi:MAG: hypothetical protein KA523_06845 [Flavobacterium sp.]|nr:hypothetical protein [Flavobacterium sp.]
MNKNLHQNYLKSSNLLFAVVGILIVNWIMLPGQVKNSFSIILLLLGILTFAGVGILIRFGFNWSKYLLLTLTLLGAITIPMIIFTFYPISISGILNILQQLLLIWSIVLLFRIKKK